MGENQHVTQKLHSYDNCKYNRNFLYSRRILQIFCSRVEKNIHWEHLPSGIATVAPLKDRHFTERLFGKLFADRGYISQSLFESLFVDDIHLVTKVRKNMKNSLMNLYDKLILRSN